MDGARISIYIVTYRNPDDLNTNIASILASGARARIHVINNHSQFYLKPEHEKLVTVFHNSLRPDFSTGHLARNWNQALLHGFQNLRNPVSDIVITVQDDVIFKANWLPLLLDLHRQYSFITMGGGDAFCSYLPEAVRKIGIWDERFCNIGYQAGDYFLRSLIYNRDRSSINDIGHGRLHNAAEGNVVRATPGLGLERSDSMLITCPHPNRHRREALVSSMDHHAVSQAVFEHKWGVSAVFWTAEHYSIRNSLIKNYMMYPYFENDVEDLSGKNYIVADEESRKHWALVAAMKSPDRKSSPT